jgi:hypothetical protein
MRIYEKGTMPKFKNESQEADWWASREGRDFVKRRSVETRSTGTRVKGSSLIAGIDKEEQRSNLPPASRS